jgi:hypothetical protein
MPFRSVVRRIWEFWLTVCAKRACLNDAEWFPLLQTHLEEAADGFVAQVVEVEVRAAGSECALTRTRDTEWSLHSRV